MKKTSFAELLADVASLEKKLATPTDFHTAKQESYHQTARAIARRILLPQMPANHDPQRWRDKVETVISRLTAELMLGGGMMLALSAPPASTGSLSPKESRPAAEIVTHADVVEWVKLGQTKSKKEDPGKNWKARDYKVMAEAKSEEAGYRSIATVVMRAYYSTKPVAAYARLRRAIQKYLHGSEETTGDKFLDSVAAAWVEHFSVRFPRDMKQYVGKLCREF